MGCLTTHVLDTSSGEPGAGILVELYRLGDQRTLLATMTTNGDGRWWDQDWIKPARTFTRAEADDILLEGMRDRGIGRWERTVIWLAVRIGGGAGWRRAGELKVEREALRAQVSTAAARPVATEDETPAI